MSKLDYWLIYQTPQRKWRVWADQTGEISLFVEPVLATQKGSALIEQGKAVSFAVLHARISHHYTPLLTQLALPESESWGTASP